MTYRQIRKHLTEWWPEIQRANSEDLDREVRRGHTDSTADRLRLTNTHLDVLTEVTRGIEPVLPLVAQPGEAAAAVGGLVARRVPTARWHTHDLRGSRAGDDRGCADVGLRGQPHDPAGYSSSTDHRAYTTRPRSDSVGMLVRLEDELDVILGDRGTQLLTANLATYLGRCRDDALDHIARSVRLAVRAGLPDDALAFSHHCVALNAVDDHSALEYAADRDPAPR